MTTPPPAPLPTSTAPAVPPGPTGTDKEILQLLERIGNKATPTDPAEKAAAFAEIEELRTIYQGTGGHKVDNLIIELGATYGIDAGDVLGAYIKTGVSSGPGSALASKIATRKAELGAYDSAEAKAAKTAITLAKEDKLKKNDLVVPPVDQSADIDSDDNESYINLTSQTHQCILQHYIDDVADYHRIKLGRGGAVRGTPLLVQSIAPISPSDKDAKIILVDDKDPDSSVAPINALTSLGKTTGLSSLLPAVLATAMPKIRLYKIYRNNGKENGKVEFIFPTATDRGFLTDVATKDVDGNAVPAAGNDFVMSAGYAKGRAAGIKSFDWSFVGGDPFTATRDLTAKLTIFFQDFRDLTMVRKGANLLDEKRKQRSYKYLDLIVQPDCRGETLTATSTTSPASNATNKEMVFNPDCYEIAVEVGYAAAPGIPAALKNNDTLYLTMQEHSFDIGQDGTFSLSIEYRARLATLLGDKGMNVLSPGGGHMIKDHADSTGLAFDIREVEQELEAEQSKKEPDKTELDALRAVRSHLLYVRNNGLYRSITNTLLQYDLIYSMTVDRSLYNRFTNFADYDREGGKNKLVGIDDAPALPTGAIRVAGASTRFGSEVEVADRSIEYLSLPGGTGAGTKGAFRLAAGLPLSIPGARTIIRDNLHFTTVGNLIVVALEHIIGNKSFTLPTQGKVKDLKKIHMAALDKSPTEAETEAAAEITAGSTITTVDDSSTGNVTEGDFDQLAGSIDISLEQQNKLERFRVILGSMSYEDTRAGKGGKMKAINIAHLPVSMQMFRQFMIDRVISNQRKFYSFQDFVRDILTDIVFDSLQRICFGGSTQGTQLRTGISLFNGQGVGPKGADEPITSAPLKIYNQTRTDNTGDYKSLVTSAAKASSPIFKNISSATALDFNYLMFSAFSVAILNKNLHGNEAEDKDNGIAHFHYGSTTGMMKSVNFTKTPLEFAAEERYVREGTDNLLNQLAGRYEMQMSLVGNNMFIPGQYVYFDPVALGIGKSMANDGTNRSLANLMGLGGYHIITEVGCSISPGKFETTIKALWETGGSMPPGK